MLTSRGLRRIIRRNKTGLVVAEERFLTLPANSVGIRLHLQLAPRFPAPVNVYHFTAADESAWMTTRANPMC